jgi:hypothetical protein
MIYRHQKRDGIAATECALVIPIILAFTLFTIEMCTIMFLKEAVTIAAYEGARVGIQRGGTDSLVQFRVGEFLDERGITYSSDSVIISSPGFDGADELEHVQTTVVVPASGNLPFGWFFGGMQISGKVTMRKEFANPE